MGRLPSIAIFVDGDGRIDPLVSSIAPYWQITTCESSVVLGRVVGNEQEVRVFDIQYIKAEDGDLCRLYGLTVALSNVIGGRQFPSLRQVGTGKRDVICLRRIPDRDHARDAVPLVSVPRLSYAQRL